MAKKKKARKSSRKKARKTSRKSKRRGGKRKAGKRKSSKRSRAAMKAARTRAEKKAKRSAAAKKAARSRKRHHHKGKRKAKKSRGRKRGGKKRKKAKGRKKARKSGKRKARKGGKRRKARRTSPETRAYMKRRNYEKNLAKKVAKRQRKQIKKDKEILRLQKRIERLQKAAESKRHHKKRRKHGHHHRARAANPIGSSGGMEFLAGVLGAIAGGLLSLATDRYASTHSLSTGSSGSGYADTPGTGQVYNSQAPNTAIWSSWSRMLWAAGSILAPLGVSAAIPDKHPHAKSFFQIMFFGAFTVTGVKVAADGASSLLGSTALGARLFAPEAAAVAQLGAQGQNTAAALASVDLSQATNAAGTTINQQAGQTQAFVAGTKRKQLTGASTGAMVPGNTATKTPLNAGPTGSYRGGSTPTSPPQPVGGTTPVPVVSTSTPASPTHVSTPAPSGGMSASGTGLPGNMTGPMCLSCAKPQHGGSCDIDGYDVFDPAGEGSPDATADGDGDVT